MRPHTIPLAALLVVPLAACGDDGGGAAIDAGAAADARADAPPPIDATPPIDAQPAALACLGDPLPDTADDPVTVSGQTVGLDGFALGAVGDVKIAAFGADDVQLGDDVFSNASGFFAISAATGGAPLDAYLIATKPGHATSYLFPPTAVTSDLGNAQLPIFTDEQLSTVATLAGVQREVGKGLAIVVVVDCAGELVEGAVVDAVGGGEVVYLGEDGIPDADRTFTSTTGLAAIFNIAPGTVTMDATVGDADLRDNDVRVFADQLTATLLVP